LVTGRGGCGVTRRKKSVRIESLFIDEGFGTLDPETLDIALGALEGLRQGNKSIGVISHVGLLKERISTQIVVHKSSSGHSTLQTLPA
jgi:DNA repair protein SbcC/Rad50